MRKQIIAVIASLLALSAFADTNESNVLSLSAHKIMYFSEYAKPIVENAINEWQKKDEFEKLADWQKRVNETTRNAKIKELTKQCEQDYLHKYADMLKTAVVIDGPYDAENEVFLLSHPSLGTMIIPVPLQEARDFKQNWSTAKVTPKFFVENDVPAFASLDIYFPSTKKRYTYSNQASLKYEQVLVDYNFEDIAIASTNTTSAPKGQQTIGEKKLSVGKSAVDVTIPETGAANPNTFVVIIANENYKSVASVPYALNDGRVFAKYCQRTLGIPAQNIKVHENATKNEMTMALAWLKNVCEKYEGEASVIFYYAGHGIPDPANLAPYLLPTDGSGRYVETGYKLDELYDRLGAMPSKSVMVLLDACFSGENRDGKMLASERGVALKSHAGEPKGNMVVFSAAQGDETALPYDQEGHGMFTYYVLKKLQDTKGNVTLDDLSSYVIREVGRVTAVKDKPQTPSIKSAPAVSGSWKNWKLR